MAAEIIKFITVDWILPHGPMRILVTDQESGIMGEEPAQWLARWQIQIKTKESGSHAQIVERHHELLRQLLHRVMTQSKEGKIKIPFDQFVAKCFI
eukprot:1414896-Karenia_brevis.AAC.1